MKFDYSKSFAMYSSSLCKLKLHHIMKSFDFQVFSSISNHQISFSNASATSAIKTLDVSIWDNTTRCVVLTIPNHMNDVLNASENHPEEATYINNVFVSSNRYSVKRFNTFLGGRQALRLAFKSLNYNLNTPIFKDLYGAPILVSSSQSSSLFHLQNIITDNPCYLSGSISHKDSYVVGIASVTSSKQGNLGIDIEKSRNKASSRLKDRILTQNEQDSLGRLQIMSTDNSYHQVSVDEEVLLRFSLKESIFKALHPFICQPIGFHEVEVFPQSDGTAELKFQLVHKPSEFVSCITDELDKDEPAYINSMNEGIIDLDDTKREENHIKPSEVIEGTGYKVGSEDTNISYKAYWMRFQESYWLTAVRIWLK